MTPAQCVGANCYVLAIDLSMQMLTVATTSLHYLTQNKNIEKAILKNDLA